MKHILLYETKKVVFLVSVSADHHFFKIYGGHIGRCSKFFDVDVTPAFLEGDTGKGVISRVAGIHQ